MMVKFDAGMMIGGVTGAAEGAAKDGRSGRENLGMRLGIVEVGGPAISFLRERKDDRGRVLQQKRCRTGTTVGL